MRSSERRSVCMSAAIVFHCRAHPVLLAFRRHSASGTELTGSDDRTRWSHSRFLLIVQVSAEGTERLASAVASADGRFLLTGGAKGLIVLRWLHSLQVLWP